MRFIVPNSKLLRMMLKPLSKAIENVPEQSSERMWSEVELYIGYSSAAGYLNQGLYSDLIFLTFDKPEEKRWASLLNTRVGTIINVNYEMAKDVGEYSRGVAPFSHYLEAWGNVLEEYGRDKDSFLNNMMNPENELGTSDLMVADKPYFN